MTLHELHNKFLREPIDRGNLGIVVLDKTGAFEAESHQKFTLTHTADRIGVDYSGSLRVVCGEFVLRRRPGVRKGHRIESPK